MAARLVSHANAVKARRPVPEYARTAVGGRLSGWCRGGATVADRERLDRESEYARRRAKKLARSSHQKYANQRTSVNGVAFDSKAEARYWKTLLQREASGEILNLRRQVVFELAPSVVIGGRTRPPLRYIADFVFECDGKQVVADVKGAVPERIALSAT